MGGQLAIRNERLVLLLALAANLDGQASAPIEQHFQGRQGTLLLDLPVSKHAGFQILPNSRRDSCVSDGSAIIPGASPRRGRPWPINTPLTSTRTRTSTSTSATSSAHSCSTPVVINRRALITDRRTERVRFKTIDVPAVGQSPALTRAALIAAYLGLFKPP